MKYIWSFSVGFIITFISVGLFSGNMNVSLFLITLLPLALTLIIYLIYKFTDLIGLLAFPVIAFIGEFIYLIAHYSELINFDEFSLTAIVYLVIIIVFTLLLKNVEPNPLMGIRTNYTQNNKVVWKKTHEFFSIISVLFMPMIFALIFWGFGWGRFWTATGLFLLPEIIAALYAFIIGSHYEKSEIIIEKQELKEQIAKEQGYKIS